MQVTWKRELFITLIIIFIADANNIVCRVFVEYFYSVGLPSSCTMGELEKTWKESVTLQFRIIPVSRHLSQGVKKTCTAMKSSDPWAEIWMRDIPKITLTCLLSHLRATAELNKWIYAKVRVTSHGGPEV